MTKKKSKGEQTKATVKVKVRPTEIKFVDKIEEQAKEFNKKVTRNITIQ